MGKILKEKLKLATLYFPEALYYYFLQEEPEQKVIPPSYLAVTSITSFFVIILGCQVAIELKKFWMNRADDEADQLAAEAHKNLRQAKQRLQRQPTRELRVMFLPFGNLNKSAKIA